jgi:RNA polymerase sigma-70 factor (ECF subfamily)
MNPGVTIRLPVLLKPGADELPRHASPVLATSETEASDEVLLTGVCEGSREALAVLFRRHARIVRGVAYRVLRDPSEADDLLQDIFLLVHRLCKTFDSSKGSAKFWILQMTYRRAISRRRYLSCRHFYTRLNLDDAADGTRALGTKNESCDEAVNRLIGQEALQKMFKELSEDQQETLRLFFFDGYTFDEIATKLGQTTGNISHHYYRGLEKLRRQMQIFDGKLQAKRAL